MLKLPKGQTSILRRLLNRSYATPHPDLLDLYTPNLKGWWHCWRLQRRKLVTVFFRDGHHRIALTDAGKEYAEANSMAEWLREQCRTKRHWGQEG